MFVWIGAVALALAGAFLVKYSWENQLLSPLARLWLAAGFGVALVGAAFPLARRADRVAAGYAAAGVSTLYGVVFAASSVYSFLGPGVALGLMAAVTALAVGLSLRFGAFVALLGLVGGFLTPALIGGEEGGRGALVAYLVVLQTGLVFLTRQRGWIGLSVLTLAGSAAWAAVLVLTGGASPADRLLAGALTLATAAVFVWNAARLQRVALATPGRRAGVLALGFAAVGAAATLLGTLAFLQNFSAQELALVAVLSAGTCALAWWDRRYAALPWLTLGLSGTLVVASRFTLEGAGGGPSGFWYAVCAGYGGLFAAAGYAGSWSPTRRAAPGATPARGWGASGPETATHPLEGVAPRAAAGPLAGLARVTPAAQWATLGVAAAAGFAAMTWVLGPFPGQLGALPGLRRAWSEGHPLTGWEPLLAVFGVPLLLIAAASFPRRRAAAAGPWAVGGFGLLLGAVGVSVGAWALPLGFAAVAVAAAAFGLGSRRRGVRPHLAWPVGAAAALAAGFLGWVDLAAFPRVAGGRNLVADWLAVPALALAAWTLTRWRGSAASAERRRPLVVLIEAAAGVVLAVCWLVTVRDLVPPGHDPRLPAFVASLNQVSWVVTGWTLLGSGVLWLRRFGRPAAPGVATALVAGGAVVAAIGLGLALNPLWNPAVTTGPDALGGLELQLRLLAPAAALWWVGGRLPVAEVGRVVQAVAAAVFAVSAAVAVRQVFGDGAVAVGWDPMEPAGRIDANEAAAAVGVAALLAAGLGWLKPADHPRLDPLGVLPGVARCFAAAALCLGVVQLFWFNPLWNPAAAAEPGVLALRWLAPAAACGLAAWVLRGVRPGGGLALAAAVGGFGFGVLVIRWVAWGGDPRLLDLRGPALVRLGLKEAACHALLFLTPGLVALAAADRGGSGGKTAAVRGFGGVCVAAGAALALIGVAGVCNPLWREAGLASTPVFNGLLFAFGAPAVGIGAASWWLGRAEASGWAKPLRHALATAAVVLAFGGVTLLVRHGFSWPDLSLGAGVSGAPEWWGYSLAWLALGIALLAAGVWRGSAVLRYASLAVLLLAIGKVFLFDVAALGGLFRVASFLGLGLTLMALGFVYQRFVFRSAEAV